MEAIATVCCYSHRALATFPGDREDHHVHVRKRMPDGVQSGLENGVAGQGERNERSIREAPLESLRGLDETFAYGTYEVGRELVEAWHALSRP